MLTFEIQVPHGLENKTSPVVAFKFNVMGNLNLTMDSNFTFWPRIKSDFARNVEVTLDEVGLVQRPGGWDLFFTEVMQQLVGLENAKWKDGIAPTPIMQMIAA